jgi:hypothetical protein
MQGTLADAGFQEVATVDPWKAARAISKFREGTRLWRNRGKAPSVAAAVQRGLEEQRPIQRLRAMMFGAKPEPDAPSRKTAALLAELLRQFETLWKATVNRCEYPLCGIGGGRYYSGRSKECPKCQLISRTSRWRHRTGKSRPRVASPV